MLRLKYKLYQGTQPQDTIVSAIGGCQMFMGQFQNGDFLYGEIVTGVENQATLEAVLSNWEVEFLSDGDAITYIDSIFPTPGTVVQQKVTANAASIVDGKIQKNFTVGD